MQIELTKIGEIRKEGKWPKMELEFVRDGKEQKRTLVAIGPTKAVMQALRDEFKEGDSVEIKVEKDGDFFNWVGITKAGVASGKTSKTVSTYETPDERARKQVYITRSASVNAANEYLKNQGKPYSLQNLLATADDIVYYVLGLGEGAGGSDEEDKPEDVEEPPKKASKRVKRDDGFEDDYPL